MFVHSRYPVAAVALTAFVQGDDEHIRLSNPRSARNELDHKAHATKIIRERKLFEEYCQKTRQPSRLLE